AGEARAGWVTGNGPDAGAGDGPGQRPLADVLLEIEPRGALDDALVAAGHVDAVLGEAGLPEGLDGPLGLGPVLEHPHHEVVASCRCHNRLRLLRPSPSAGPSLRMSKGGAVAEAETRAPPRRNPATAPKNA